MTRFRKLPDGGWAFAVNNEFGIRIFKAIRNEAGFGGREWELWMLDTDQPDDGTPKWKQVADQMSSRGEAVGTAHWHGRTTEDFWDYIAAAGQPSKESN